MKDWGLILHGRKVNDHFEFLIQTPLVEDQVIKPIEIYSFHKLGICTNHVKKK